MSRVLKNGENQITSPYGPRGSGFHSGIDIVKYKSQLDYIVAHSDGTVITAVDGLDNMPGSNSAGNQVKIDHGDGWYTWYVHMKKGSVTVKKGDRVKRGQVIGYMGNSGDSSGAHLHFGVEYPKVNTRIDPTPYINADLGGKGVITIMGKIIEVDKLNAFIIANARD